MQNAVDSRAKWARCAILFVAGAAGADAAGNKFAVLERSSQSANRFHR